MYISHSQYGFSVIITAAAGLYMLFYFYLSTLTSLVRKSWYASAIPSSSSV